MGMEMGMGMGMGMGRLLRRAFVNLPGEALLFDGFFGGSGFVFSGLVFWLREFVSDQINS